MRWNALESYGMLWNVLDDSRTFREARIESREAVATRDSSVRWSERSPCANTSGPVTLRLAVHPPLFRITT